MIVGSGFATFAITEMANFCTTDNPFEPTTLANNTNQLFVFAFSPKSISWPCELDRHQDARQEYACGDHWRNFGRGRFESTRSDP
jgi:hypothetical protein